MYGWLEIFAASPEKFIQQFMGEANKIMEVTPVTRHHKPGEMVHERVVELLEDITSNKTSMLVFSSILQVA